MIGWNRGAIQERWILPAILGLAFLLRLPLFLLNLGHEERFFTPDSARYVALGTSFEESYFDQTSQLFGFSLLRTPGYPALIRIVYALAGPRPWAVILVQVALGLSIVWLVYLLAARLFGLRAARWAALAFSVDPISIILVSYLQPEVLFTLALVAGTLAWVRGLQERSWGWGLAAGTVFGLAVLVRPIALYLPALLVPAGWFLHGGRWPRRLIFTLSLILAFAAPVGGWVARNVEVTGVPMVSTVESINILFYRAAGAVAEEEGISIDEARARLARLAWQRAGPGLNDAEWARVAGALGVEILLDHPVGAAKTWGKGAVRLLVGPGRDELLRLLGIESRTQLASVLLVGLEVVLYGLVMAGGALGLRQLVKDGRWFELSVLSLFLLYFVVVSSGVEAYSRFRVPMMPFFAVLAGYGSAVAVFGRSSSAETGNLTLDSDPEQDDLSREIASRSRSAH